VAALGRIGEVSGRAFNLGGGPANAVSLRQLIAHIETLTQRRLALEFSEWRAGDQRYYVTDASAARRDLGLPEPRDWRSGVAALAAWLREDGAPQAAPRRAEAVS
jgi:CDP-paratose 2-epimerase